MAKEVLHISKEIFSRYELKYLISYETYLAFAEQLSQKMKNDQFGNMGKYNIISLYFDSDDHTIYYETRNNLPFRQKLRLRIYNNATLDTVSFLELKQKFNRVVNKRRTKLKLGDAYQYLEQYNSDDISVSNRQIMAEVDSFRSLYRLKPELIVSYDRHAFIGVEEEDLRVTFDYNLRCRKDDLRIESGPHGMRFVDPHLVVMEVKVTHSVPLWLSRLLSDYACPRKSVSKYCTSFELVNAEKPKGAIHELVL